MPRKNKKNPKRKILFVETTLKGGAFIDARKKELGIETNVNYLKHLLIKDGCPAEDLIF